MSTEKVGKRRVTLEIPGEALLGLRVPLEEAGDVMRMGAAMKLCELGLLSSGAAARLAGVPRRSLPVTAGGLRCRCLSTDGRAVGTGDQTCLI